MNIRQRDINALVARIADDEIRLAERRIELRVLTALQAILPADLPGYLRIDRDDLPGDDVLRARLVVSNEGERGVALQLLTVLPALPAVVAEYQAARDDRPRQHFLASRDPLVGDGARVSVAPVARYEHDAVWWWAELDGVLLRVEVEYSDQWRAPAIDRMPARPFRGSLSRPVRPPEADVFSPTAFDATVALTPVDGSLTADAVVLVLRRIRDLAPEMSELEGAEADIVAALQQAAAAVFAQQPKEPPSLPSDTPSCGAA